jgi:hypothetical protein
MVHLVHLHQQVPFVSAALKIANLLLVLVRARMNAAQQQDLHALPLMAFHVVLVAILVFQEDVLVATDVLKLAHPYLCLMGN